MLTQPKLMVELDPTGYKPPLHERRRDALLAAIGQATHTRPGWWEVCDFCREYPVQNIRSGYWLAMLLVEFDRDIQRAGYRWLIRKRWKSSYREPVYILYLWRTGQRNFHLDRDTYCEAMMSKKEILRTIAGLKKVHPQTRGQAHRILQKQIAG